MANKEEEIISNMSYTNSDFRTIYPQLLDTAKVLTNKWEPSLSNESDPGNILIKEAAIIGDKNNYHIDKNVLECFPLSATQTSSARQIYDLVGYNMHWYRSAKADAIITLYKSFDSINSANGTELTAFQIPTNTQLSDDSGEYVYTTLEPVKLSTQGEPQTVPTIQGIIEQYEINGSYTITLENLDENQRLYFPHNYIAENGIFVCSAGLSISNGFNVNIDSLNPDFWEQVDNLAQYKTGSKVFKFGLDLYSDNCYIQFPEDIMSSNLIGDGLNVYYTTTMGENGTIKSSILNKFISDITIAAPTVSSGTTNLVINDYVVISNKASTQGKNPETLTSAYRNYKKLIGTYDSLISRRDYENAIFNLNNDEGTYNLVSNAFVADRTTDPNYTQQVVTTDLINQYTISNTQPGTLESYDIVLYLLKSSKSMATIDDYNLTFRMDNQDGTLDSIKIALDDKKAVQHNFNYPKETIIGNSYANSTIGYFNVDNLLALNGTLTTYYKVDNTEASEIQSNVIQALITKYNAREIDYGNSIEYEELVETIKNADDRIRSVALNTPVYEPTMQFTDGTTQSFYFGNASSSYPTSQILNNTLVAKSILSGAVQLFNFDKSFQIDFGQTNAATYKNVSKFTTSNPIQISDANYTELVQNDIVQILTRSFVETENYGSLVKVVANFDLSSGQVYVLSGSNKIKFVYTDSNSQPQFKTFSAGTIIRANNISLTAQVGDINWNSTDTTNTSLIRASQSVSILELSNISIPKGVKYYVITNKVESNKYVLSLTANVPRILVENEYLLFTDDTGMGIIRLESGTTILSATNVDLISDVTDLESILDDSVEDAKLLWSTLTTTLSAQENEIVTLTAGDKVKCANVSPITLGNDFSNNPSDEITRIDYIFYGDNTVNTIQKVTGIADYKIYCRSNLQLTVNSITPQQLHGVQTMTITYTNPGESESTHQITSSTPNMFLSNYPLNMVGGTDVDSRVLNEFTGNLETKLSIYNYSVTNMTSNIGVSRNNSGLLFLQNSDFDASSHDIILNFTFNQTETSAVTNGEYIIPIVTVVPPGETITFSFQNVSSGGTAYIKDTYGILTGATTTSYVINNSGGSTILTATNYIAVKVVSGKAQNIKIKLTQGNIDGVVLNIGYMKKLNGLNTDEINSISVVRNNSYSYDIEQELTDVLDIISDLPGYSTFDWTYEVPDSLKVLQPVSGESYFNMHHIYNKLTLPMIDFDKTSIKVSPSSIK